MDNYNRMNYGNSYTNRNAYKNRNTETNRNIDTNRNLYTNRNERTTGSENRMENITSEAYQSYRRSHGFGSENERNTEMQMARENERNTGMQMTGENERNTGMQMTRENERNTGMQMSGENVDYTKDYGPMPLVANIDEATKTNKAFRSALWTGNNLQLTLMSLGIGEDIGVEMHPDVDQFIRVEQGQGMVQMGESKDNLNKRQFVYDEFAFIVPAGTWHNLVNTGKGPLKVYSIYAPPQHPRGTVHMTKEDAMHED